MKKIIVTLIVFCLLTSALAQTLQRTRNYYYWINQAELAICDSNYDVANECYDKAFLCHNPIGVHLLTAYYVNTKFTNDTNRIYQYATQLLLCGDNGLAGRYKREKNFDSTVFHRLAQLESLVNPTIDTNLQKELKSIIDKDQSYAHHYSKSRMEVSLNLSVEKDIFSLYRNHRIINDFTAGIHFCNYYLYAPAQHLCQSNRHRLQRLLRKEVVKGNIRADLYMELEEIYLSSKIFRQSNEQLYNKCKYGLEYPSIFTLGDCLFITEPINIHKINRNRKKLGLSETYEDYIKKVKWQYTTRALYWTSIPIDTYGDDDENQKEANKLIQEIDAEHSIGDFHRQYYPLPPKKK